MKCLCIELEGNKSNKRQNKDSFYLYCSYGQCFQNDATSQLCPKTNQSTASGCMVKDQVPHWMRACYTERNRKSMGKRSTYKQLLAAEGQDADSLASCSGRPPELLPSRWAPCISVQWSRRNFSQECTCHSHMSDSDWRNPGSSCHARKGRSLFSGN